jgi:hypothetical protein
MSTRRRSSPPVTTLGSLWLVAGLALVEGPHLLRFPLFLALLCVLTMAWRVARDLRGWPLPPTWLRLVLTLPSLLDTCALLGLGIRLVGRCGTCAIGQQQYDQQDDTHTSPFHTVPPAASSRPSLAGGCSVRGCCVSSVEAGEAAALSGLPLFSSITQ